MCTAFKIINYAHINLFVNSSTRAYYEFILNLDKNIYTKLFIEKKSLIRTLKYRENCYYMEQNKI